STACQMVGASWLTAIGFNPARRASSTQRLSLAPPFALLWSLRWTSIRVIRLLKRSSASRSVASTRSASAALPSMFRSLLTWTSISASLLFRREKVAATHLPCRTGSAHGHLNGLYPRRAGGPFGAERRAAHLGAAPPFPAGRRRITVPAVQEPNDPAGTRSPHGSTSQLPRAAHPRAPLPHDRGGAAAHLRAAGRPLRACGERARPPAGRARHVRAHPRRAAALAADRLHRHPAGARRRQRDHLLHLHYRRRVRRASLDRRRGRVPRRGAPAPGPQAHLADPRRRGRVHGRFEHDRDGGRVP